MLTRGPHSTPAEAGNSAQLTQPVTIFSESLRVRPSSVSRRLATIQALDLHKKTYPLPELCRGFDTNRALSTTITANCGAQATDYLAYFGRGSIFAALITTDRFRSSTVGLGQRRQDKKTDE
jgi:hypothetical protein